MIKVGITGGIGSGKSTVCKLFELLGVPVYYADLEAKNITFTQESVMKAVRQEFGDEAYIDGALNRPYISQIVFNNKEKLAKLNAIIHPAVAEHFKKWLHVHSNAIYIIKEAAILFESGAYKSVDKVIAVTAPEKLRISRVMKRDGFSHQEILQRMNNQWPEEKKVNMADEVVYADDKQLVIPQVLEIHQSILNKIK